MLEQHSRVLRVKVGGAYAKLALSTWKRQSLTVVMFHRVLPAERMRALGAMPEWTITPDLFLQCIKVLKKQFQIVDLNAVRDASFGKGRVLDKSLLITFDDGWRDTLEFACPILHQEDVPAVCFIVTRARTGNGSFWVEAAHKAVMARSCPKWVRQSLLDRNFQQGLEGSIYDRRNLYVEIISALRRVPQEKFDKIRQGWLKPWEDKLQSEFLDPEDWHRLEEKRIAIGSHGATHRPFDSISDFKSECFDSAKQLQIKLPKSIIDSLSFPHGKYTENILHEIKAGPYRHIFTSEPILNYTKGPAEIPRLYGRISLSTNAMSANGRKLDESMLMNWLNRPLRRIGFPRKSRSKMRHGHNAS